MVSLQTSKHHWDDLANHLKPVLFVDKKAEDSQGSGRFFKKALTCKITRAFLGYASCSFLSFFIFIFLFFPCFL